MSTAIMNDEMITRSLVEAGITKHCQGCGTRYVESLRYCRLDGRELDTVVTALDTVPTSRVTVRMDDPMIGRVLAGRYRLLARLGNGGMGVVYKALHVRMNRLAAVKIMTSDLCRNSEFVARFHREAEMASYLDHPNAVAAYDFGEAEDGLLYLAMRFIDGQTLASIIDHAGALGLERAARIIRQIAAALDAAQRVGLIHRDLKPQNVMVSWRAGQSDWVEVVDFGAAKLVRVDPRLDLTRSGFVLGTPDYMSPEQVSGQELDSRSDLYSLGVLAYEMITGALPFEGSTPQERMASRLYRPPLQFARVRPDLDLPAGVESVIRKALAGDRDERYSSAVEFAEEFEAEVCPKKDGHQLPSQATQTALRRARSAFSTAPLDDGAETFRANQAQTILALDKHGREKAASERRWPGNRRALLAVPVLMAIFVFTLF
ncbi:MAG TPA: serine/threonine-protein kinase, partial [Blastocatellia bacterium]|nr:serine/threonine-protein kinase [Blastocatellia bacterium]